jgi:hypothetical protein
VAQLRGEAGTAELALQTARRAEADYEERARAVQAQEAELRLHEELDLAYGELRQELNDQVRPELGEIASAFLAQLTDGRSTSMEINDAYDILVLDEGEEKPVISGGEEDVANLVLRLSRRLLNLVVMPGYLLMLATGMWMGHLADLLDAHWTEAAMNIWGAGALFIALWTVCLRRQLTLREAGDSVSTRYRRARWLGTSSGIAAALVLLVILGYMVFKPG